MSYRHIVYWDQVNLTNHVERLRFPFFLKMKFKEMLRKLGLLEFRIRIMPISWHLVRLKRIVHYQLRENLDCGYFGSELEIDSEARTTSIVPGYWLSAACQMWKRRNMSGGIRILLNVVSYSISLSVIQLTGHLWWRIHATVTNH